MKFNLQIQTAHGSTQTEEMEPVILLGMALDIHHLQVSMIDVLHLICCITLSARAMFSLPGARRSGAGLILSIAKNTPCQ
jgi:hypothetical protein